MQQERDAVGGKLHVELGHPVALRVPETQRRERVLGRELAGAAVGTQRRIGPVKLKEQSRKLQSELNQRMSDSSCGIAL